MSSPESLLKAFAAGMIEALLGSDEKPKGKKEKPVVVPVDTVKEAVRSYLDNLAQQEVPAQQDLFSPPQVDFGDAIYDRVQEARARAEARENPDIDEPGTYRPDQAEGAPWQSPIA